MNLQPQMDNSNLLFLLALYTTTLSSLLLSTLPPSHGENDKDPFKACQQFYSCGNLTGVEYPFYGNGRPPYCGHPGFELQCTKDNRSFIHIDAQEFRVLNIISSPPDQYTMTLARNDLLENPCSSNDLDTKIDHALFSLPRDIVNINISYGCKRGLQYIYSFTCGGNQNDPIYAIYEDMNHPGGTATWTCQNHTVVPVCLNPMFEPAGGEVALRIALSRGFDVNYNVNWTQCGACMKSHGYCGSDEASKGFSCICETGNSNQTCPTPNSNPSRVKLKILIGVGSAGAAVILMSIGFFFYLRRYKKRHSLPYSNTRSLSSDLSVISRDAEKGSRLLGVHLFTYEELEEATDHFNPSKELGDGGFGTVYYGKLQDGREVAVKRLYENNYKRVEQFMNEVEILTDLRHQNLVSLYGCTSRHSRELLLVYEYISNGTVADHLHGQKTKPGMLPWRIRMNIALETASALSYLHASDIIHRDVKTNNILLDKNFRVKVADFGLSRLFPTDRTHISTAPQGTPGYVDPEYHECYQLTDKSDVYSFGVVLIELISSMPAVDITRHRHEINLSTMAINKIQHGALSELVDPSLGFESNYKVRKMINAVAEVAFQCLQGAKDMRPSMLEVLETLNDIQNDFHSKGQAEEMDMREDDTALLKSEPPPFSPESMASNLRSSSTTPNTSG